MSDLCGSENTSSGEPCAWNEAEQGPCPWHSDDDPPDNGRDSKLTKERQEAIASHIEQGKSIQSAARMNGITPQTVYNWLDRGEEDENSIYADFFDRITRARGYGEETYFNVVWEIAKEQGDHRFLASLMKQRYPDAWASDEDAPGVDTNATVIEIPESVAKEWQRQPE